MQCYRLIEDILICMAFLGVKGLNIQKLLMYEELERFFFSLIDLFTSLTLLYIYHKLGQKKLKTVKRDKKLSMKNLIQRESEFLRTDDSIFNRVYPISSQQHIVEIQSSDISEKGGMRPTDRENLEQMMRFNEYQL